MKNKDYLLQNMAASVRFLTMRMLLLFLLLFFHLRACHSSPSMQPLCHDDESHALLQLKESLVINESTSYDPSAYPKVASWKIVDGESGDCCSWDGVECDGDSSHVIGLDLSSSFLYGSICCIKLNPSKRSRKAAISCHRPATNCLATSH
jgi:hypothetical protein